MKRQKVVMGLVILLVVMMGAWTARAAPQTNPPPAIWCPGPGGVMSLCSPVPTPTWRAPDQQSSRGQFWITGRRSK